MRRTLGVDLDGVIYNWHISVYEYHINFKNYAGSFNDFWTKEYKNFTPEWWKYIVDIDILYSDRPPVSDCFSFLDKIVNRFEVYYITSRPECVKTTTEQYLKRYKFPFQDNLIFTKDKVNTARLLKLSYAIDDLPEQIEGLSRVTKTFMIAQPYNIDYQDKCTTVKSLTQILGLLED
jgi:uncharacterized HAD superfamily protein